MLLQAAFALASAVDGNTANAELHGHRAQKLLDFSAGGANRNLISGVSLFRKQQSSCVRVDSQKEFNHRSIHSPDSSPHLPVLTIDRPYRRGQLYLTECCGCAEKSR